jgi:UDP-N-acetylglucosamine 2-epimerase
MAESEDSVSSDPSDQLSQLLFTPSADGDMNPHREGIVPEKIHLVGNMMIDTLIRLLPVARQARKNGTPASMR